MSRQFLKTDKNLIDSILILNKTKIKYWVCHGTLLGIIRDKSLIEWGSRYRYWCLEKKISNIILKIIL